MIWNKKNQQPDPAKELTRAGGYTYEQWLQAIKPTRRERFMMSVPLAMCSVLAVANFAWSFHSGAPFPWGPSDPVARLFYSIAVSLALAFSGINIHMSSQGRQEKRIKQLMEAYPEHVARNERDEQCAVRIQSEHLQQQELQQLIDLRRSHRK